MTAGLLLRILSSGMECCRRSRVRWREGGREGAVFSQSERIFRSVRLCSERLPAEEEAVRGTTRSGGGGGSRTTAGL